MRQHRNFSIAGMAGVLAVAAAVGVMQQHVKAADARAAALDDPTIVAIFDAANTWDIQTGELGAKKGTTKEVREFGEQLESAHKAVRQKGRDLAKKLGVTPTPPKDFALAKAHSEAMAKLKAAKGREFDRAFLQNEVDFHKAVIDAVTQTLLPALKNQEVKDLVTQVAPAFQAHMEMAQHLLDNMKS